MFENDAASDLWGNLRLASSVLVPVVYLHVGGGAGEQHVALSLLHPPPPPRCVTPPRLYAQFVGAAPPKKGGNEPLPAESRPDVLILKIKTATW